MRFDLARPEGATRRPPASGPIVLVVPTFPKLSETFVVRHAVGLVERGWDVQVVCRSSPTAAWRAFPGLDATMAQRVHVAPPIARAEPTTVGRALGEGLRRPVALARAIGRRGLRRGVARRLADQPIRALRPRLIHFEFGTLALEQADLAAAAGCHVITSFRGFDLNFAGLETEGYYDPLWPHLDAAHLLGEDLWRRALARGCPEDLPHALIPPALDPDSYPPRHSSRAGGPLRVLSVGRLEWKKGTEHALQAVAMLRQAGVDCRLRIVGEGAHLPAVTYACHDLGLSDATELLGARPHAEVIEEMRAADIFLHLAVSEGFCNAVLEAQAVGLPVVCSDADGLRENVDDATTGFVVPRRRPERAAEALQRLANDPELRGRMGAAGRARVRRHFTLDRQLDAFESFYHQVLDRPPRAGGGAR
ncbi:MAG: glycosyltransferase family 4 protein [Acidobacteriota bacterium]